MIHRGAIYKSLAETPRDFGPCAITTVSYTHLDVYKRQEQI